MSWSKKRGKPMEVRPENDGMVDMAAAQDLHGPDEEFGVAAAGQYEKVVYRGGWRLPMRSTVTKRSVAVLTGKTGTWKRVAGSDTQIQRDVFVKVTVFEQAGGAGPGSVQIGRQNDSGRTKYALRMHVHQPDMNISLSKSIRSRELATILLPLFRGSVSKPVAQAIENAALLPEEDDDDEGGNVSIVERSLKRFIKTGWAPRRIHLIKWLLERLRLNEDIDGKLVLNIEPSPEEARKWVERETRRRFKLLTGGKSSLALQHACASRVQNVWRGHVARKKFADIRDEYDDKIRDAKADMIGNAWRNHTGRKKLHRLGQAYKHRMKEQAAVVVQSQIRGALARLHFKHTKDAKKRIEDAAIMLQSAWRCRCARREHSRLKTEYEHEVLLKGSAIIIQCWYRSWKARSRVEKLSLERNEKLAEQTAIKLQCAWRGNRAYAKYKQLLAARNKKKDNAARAIQRSWRGAAAAWAQALEAKLIYENYKKNWGAERIAALWRGHVQRKQTREHLSAKREIRVKKRRRDSTTMIQKQIRGALARTAFKFARSQASKENAAALRIQSLARGRASRRASALMIKRRRMADRLAKQLQAEAERKYALQLQADEILRKERETLAVRRIEIENNTAALMVQSAWRGRLARAEFRRIRKKYDAEIANAKATQVQFAWRNHAGRKKLHKLNQWYNNKLREEASVIVQQHSRGMLARMRYKNAKDEKERRHQASIIVTSQWRGFVARKHYRVLVAEKEAKIREQAALVIQCAWRSRKARKHVDKLMEERQKLLEEQAAIMLQSAWRRKLAYNEFHKLRRQRLNRERLAEEKAARKAEEEAAKQKRIMEAKKRAAKAKTKRLEEVKKALEAQEHKRFKENVKTREQERQMRAEETRKKRETAARELAGREARQRRREEQEEMKRRRRAEKQKQAYANSPEGKRAAAAKAAKEAAELSAASDANRSKSKPKESTYGVYHGVWQMPCDLRREPWCEVHVKVLERRNPYRLRFEGKVKLMWTTEVDNNKDGTLIDLSRSAKYTVTENQLQQVLLPAFDTELMSPIAARRQTTTSGTSTYGGKKSAESAMFKWAQSGFAPLRTRVIQWILRRMRVGVGSKSLVLIMSEEMTESYEVDKSAKGKRRKSNVAL